MKKIIGNPNKSNNDLIELIKKTKINNYYLKNQKDFRDRILSEIDQNDHILDIGMAMRDKHKKIKSKNLQTLDVNDFGDYPDIICDICNDISGLEEKYDKIICLAILEHVYDPFKAIQNLMCFSKFTMTGFAISPHQFSKGAFNIIRGFNYFS